MRSIFQKMTLCIVFSTLLNSLVYPFLGNITDSLENRLNRAASDTAKVLIYNEFARDLITGGSRNYYQGLQYSYQGGLNQFYYQSLQCALLGLKLAEQIQYERGQAELLRTIGSSYFHLTDYEKAIEHYEKALFVCEKMQNLNGMALNYYNIGLSYFYRKTNIIYSLDMLHRAMMIWKQLDDKFYMIRAYDMIIIVYSNLGEWKLAMSYAEQSLALTLEMGNREEEASLYQTFAEINASIGNEEAQREFYYKSLKIYEELNDQLHVADVTHSIAINLHANNPEKAIGLLRKSVAIYEEISPDSRSFFAFYDALANMFALQGNHDSTKYYKEKALSKAILSGNLSTMAKAYNTVGLYHLKHGELNKAEKRIHHAYEIAVRSGMYEILSESLSGLSTINYRKGNYRVAFEYLLQYQTINDSLNKENDKRSIQQLTMQYEFEKAMTEKNEAIRAQLARQQQSMRYQKIIVVIISIALICSAVLLVIILYINKRNRLANKKLEQQHSEILRINDELQESHQELSRYKDNLEIMVKEQTEKLRQKEIQLRTLSDNLPGGFIYQKQLLDDGRESVSYISNTAENWLGMSVDVIMNNIERLYQQMLPEDLERKRQLERESIETMSSHSFEYRMMKGDEEVWLLENAIPRAYKNRNIVWDGIIVDITDRKKFEQDLIEAKEHAEESDRLKSAFLANMSHEIRTPMNGIVGFLGFIERDNLTPEKRNAYTGIIRSNVQQLLQLIGDIIDLSKIDSRLLSLNQLPFDLNHLLDEMESFFQDFIFKSNKKLVLMLDRSQFISPGIINSDPVRLRQILSNLIKNSIKFTDKGYVRFGYRKTEDGKYLEFFVEDTGIGIHESKHEYIFERFKQALDGNTQIKYGGTGLGLPISKSLVELMGGKISLESVEGAGSTFHFTLPFYSDELQMKI